VSKTGLLRRKYRSIFSPLATADPVVFLPLFFGIPSLVEPRAGFPARGEPPVWMVGGVALFSAREGFPFLYLFVPAVFFSPKCTPSPQDVPKKFRSFRNPLSFFAGRFLSTFQPVLSHPCPLEPCPSFPPPPSCKA